MAFRTKFIGVVRRRFGSVPGDLSALDGLSGPASYDERTLRRKTRWPRRFKVFPQPGLAVLPVRRQRGRAGVLVPF